MISRAEPPEPVGVCDAASMNGTHGFPRPCSDQHPLPDNAALAARRSIRSEQGALDGPRQLAAQLLERSVVANRQVGVGQRRAQRIDELEKPALVRAKPLRAALAIPDAFVQRLHRVRSCGTLVLELGEPVLPFVSQCGDVRGLGRDHPLLRLEPGDRVDDPANFLRVGALDDRVIGEHPVDIEQRFQIEEHGDRVAPGEPIRGPHGAGELMPAFGELGPGPVARTASFVGSPVRGRQTFVEAGDFPLYAGCQHFAASEGLRVGVLLVVRLRDLARCRLETRSHALEIALDLEVRLSESTGATGEQENRDPDAHGSGEESRSPGADQRRTLCGG